MEPERRKISTSVSTVIIVIGLFVELIALTGIMSRVPIDKIAQIITIFGIIIMLIHQFLIMKCFHSIDHLSSDDLKRVGIGKWAYNKCESILRFLIFILFAGLTGEIVYIIISFKKSISYGDYTKITTYLDIDGKLIIVDSDPLTTIDVHWLPVFYIICALIMSLLIMLWSFAGFIYERRELKNYEVTPNDVFDLKILNPSPSKNIYKGFLRADILAVFMWLAMFFLIICNEKDALWVLVLIVVSYAYLIIRRILAIIRNYLPSVKKAYADKSRSP